MSVNLSNASALPTVLRLNDVEPGKQQYTLLCTHVYEKTTGICSYGVDGPILTTHHDDLVTYTNQLVRMFGETRIYSISTVTPVAVIDNTTY